MAGVNDFYTVLGITEQANGKIGIGLKNYGSLVVEKDEFVDIIDGDYHEDKWNK